MDTVDKGHLHPVKMLCNGFIGGQHEVFDNHGGHIALIRLDLQGPAFFVQNDLCLRKIEIYGAALSSLAAKCCGKLLHLLKHRYQRCILSKLLFSLYDGFIFQNLLHGSIAHALVDFDHRLTNLIICDLAVCIHCHQTAKRQSVHSFIQGTDPIRKGMGQHGDHPVHQIDAGPTL